MASAAIAAGTMALPVLQEELLPGGIGSKRTYTEDHIGSESAGGVTNPFRNNTGTGGGGGGIGIVVVSALLLVSCLSMTIMMAMMMMTT